jgi:hypothetical protein
MTKRRRKEPLEKVGLLTPGVLLAEDLTEHSMNYWLDRINPEDIGRLWTQLERCAKAVLPRTTWVQWVNGIIEREALRLDVTACTTQCGFALHFTVRSMSKSNGGSDGA